jgi:formylglycine-generating enzyme required for sulfatase activity
MSESADKTPKTGTDHVFLVLSLLCSFRVIAQTASPETPPPKFLQPAAFHAPSAPASARQHGAMVRILGGTYPIGSPLGHALADPQAMPQHQVTLKPFRMDRTEVTNAQFAEFLNALPVATGHRQMGFRCAAD